MKKKILLVMLLVLITIGAVACGDANSDVNDTVTSTTTTAIIQLQDGNVITSEVYNWHRNSDCFMTIETVDGTKYYVNSVNVTIIKK